MTELDKKYDYGDKDQVPSETDHSDLWLYQLACIFFGSSGFGDFQTEYKWNNDLRRRFQESEINRLLISIAASVRRRTEYAVKLNDEEKNYHGIGSKQTPKSVGILIKNLVDTEKVYPLTLREACNKIIHSDKINYDYVEAKPHAGGTLNPVIHCYGSLAKKQWNATVNISTFIEAVWNHG